MKALRRGAFFRGWRRKMGVATLLVTCALMSLWIRPWPPGREYELRLNASAMKLDIKFERVTRPESNPSMATMDTVFRRSAPYWTAVIPLTLLSAWLLFSKPRLKQA